MARKTPEGRFKTVFLADLDDLYPDSQVLFNDSAYLTGVPDILFLCCDFWAMFEAKRGDSAELRPNQPWYIEKFDQMSFARFVYPENKEEVLRDLQSAHRAHRPARISKR